MIAIKGDSGDGSACHRGRKWHAGTQPGPASWHHLSVAPALALRAPGLADVGSRYTAGQLRLRVADPTRVNREAVMPAYFRVDGLDRVAQNQRGRPILTAQQVEDVVAYLVTLK